MSTINPYKILGVTLNSSKNDIKESYKKLVLIHHPDKGGNPENFTLLKKCYKYVMNQKKNEINKINPLEDFKNTIEKQNQSKPFMDHKNFDKNVFNRTFNQYKLPSNTDHGYQNEMIQNSGTREPIENLLKQKIPNIKKQIISYQDPIPQDISNTSFSELGDEDIKDFGNNNVNTNANQNLVYEDYMKAHSEPIDINLLSKRKEYKSIDNLILERSQISNKLSDIEKQEIKQKELDNTRKEEKRLYNQYLKDKEIEKNYKSMHLNLTYDSNYKYSQKNKKNTNSTFQQQQFYPPMQQQPYPQMQQQPYPQMQQQQPYPQMQQQPYFPMTSQQTNMQYNRQNKNTKEIQNQTLQQQLPNQINNNRQNFGEQRHPSQFLALPNQINYKNPMDFLEKK
jgi:curved DNA-binding protein CbpA